MKKISILASIFLVTAVFGQKISNYKYISIPQTFKDFEKNSFGLDDSLANTLRSKRVYSCSGRKKSIVFRV